MFEMLVLYPVRMVTLTLLELEIQYSRWLGPAAITGHLPLCLAQPTSGPIQEQTNLVPAVIWTSLGIVCLSIRLLQLRRERQPPPSLNLIPDADFADRNKGRAVAYHARF